MSELGRAGLAPAGTAGRIEIGLTVIKVGGSLYNVPDLVTRLRNFIFSLNVDHIIIYPGGGATADAVRELDRSQSLGEEAAHWLALRALTVNAYFLNGILPELPVALWPELPGRAILDPFAFALADEENEGHLPHCWSVTSDSLALRAALVLRARELILLKSVKMADGMTWSEAAEAGIVDAFFPKAIAQAPGVKARLVALRQKLS